MTDFVFNIAKGRVNEFFIRVKNNDPATAALILMLLDATGIETDAVLKDKDTITDLLAGTTNEAVNGGYARITLTDADLGAIAPDDINDWFAVTIAAQNFGAIAAGNGLAKLVIAYDPDPATSSDATRIPMLAYDFVVTPDGTAIQFSPNANGLFRAP